MRAVVCRGLRFAARTTLRVAVTLSFLFFVAVGIGPLTGRYRVVTVLTGSMRPGVPAGSVAISTPERLDEVRVGQIITFEAPVADHWVVTHRVIQVVSGGAHPRVRTQGDANTAPDPWVSQLHTGPLWKVRAVAPGAGSVIRVLRSSWVHVATVLVAPALLAVLAVTAIWIPRPARPRRRAQRAATART